jgi:hypothetical protein
MSSSYTCFSLISTLDSCFQVVGLNLETVITYQIYSTKNSHSYGGSLDLNNITNKIYPCVCSSEARTQLNYFLANDCAKFLKVMDAVPEVLKSFCKGGNNNNFKDTAKGEKFLFPNEAAKNASLQPSPAKTNHVKIAVELPYSLFYNLDMIPFNSAISSYLGVDVAVEIAVSIINSRTDILRNVLVEVVKINVLDYSNVNDSRFLSTTAGYGMSVAYDAISENVKNTSNTPSEHTLTNTGILFTHYVFSYIRSGISRTIVHFNSEDLEPVRNSLLWPCTVCTNIRET